MADRTTGTATDTGTETHRAGLFDIRFIIAALIGVYGIVLVLTGILGNDHHVKDSGVINVWCGIAMVVVAVVFAGWARLRPTVVPTHVEDDEDPRPAGH